jgi:hypothetical protein
MIKAPQRQLSVRAQFLINSLIASSSNVNSEFPMRALKAKQRADQYTEELKEFILNLEHPQEKPSSE